MTKHPVVCRSLHASQASHRRTPGAKQPKGMLRMSVSVFKLTSKKKVSRGLCHKKFMAETPTSFRRDTREPEKYSAPAEQSQTGEPSALVWSHGGPYSKEGGPQTLHAWPTVVEVTQRGVGQFQTSCPQLCPQNSTGLPAYIWEGLV